MHLNDAGMIVHQCWCDIPKHFPNVELNNYIIMSNHVHGIIEILGVPLVDTLNNTGNVYTEGQSQF
jgi:putative transposase